VEDEKRAAAAVPQPRETPFMDRLRKLIEAHVRAMSSRHSRYNPQTSRERELLRQHVAKAGPNDIRDMAYRRYHEFGGYDNLKDSLVEMEELVAICRKEYPDA